MLALPLQGIRRQKSRWKPKKSAVAPINEGLHVTGFRGKPEMPSKQEHSKGHPLNYSREIATRAGGGGRQDNEG